MKGIPSAFASGQALRLRTYFASRIRYSAQDDTLFDWKL